MGHIIYNITLYTTHEYIIIIIIVNSISRCILQNIKNLYINLHNIFSYRYFVGLMRVKMIMYCRFFFIKYHYYCNYMLGLYK
jgi:hypothetical protein